MESENLDGFMEDEETFTEESDTGAGHFANLAVQGEAAEKPREFTSDSHKGDTNPPVFMVRSATYHKYADRQGEILEDYEGRGGAAIRKAISCKFLIAFCQHVFVEVRGFQGGKPGQGSRVVKGVWFWHVPGGGNGGAVKRQKDIEMKLDAEGYLVNSVQNRINLMRCTPGLYDEMFRWTKDGSNFGLVNEEEMRGN